MCKINFVQKRENENGRKGVSRRVKTDKAEKREEKGEVCKCVYMEVCWILICICDYGILLKPPCFGIRLDKLSVPNERDGARRLGLTLCKMLKA